MAYKKIINTWEEYEDDDDPRLGPSTFYRQVRRIICSKCCCNITQEDAQYCPCCGEKFSGFRKDRSK